MFLLVLTLAFQALVRPNLEYAAAVWSPYTKKNIELIENVQRRATQQVPSLKQLSYTDNAISFVDFLCNMFTET
jgi:hypothetical protein